MAITRRWTLTLLSLTWLGAAGCEDPTPVLSGRMAAPADVAVFLGCPQDQPTCDPAAGDKLHHLLLVANAQGNDLRVFDAQRRAFFESLNPLFPLSIPVGPHPRSLAIDPRGQFAFVVNFLSEDVSVVDLRPDRLVEVDTDMDSSTCAASLHPDSDRCRAGVSRVGLGAGSGVMPERLVVGPERGGILPVYVSLSGTGELAELGFHYPDEESGWPQRMSQVRLHAVGGRPSGLALSADGASLWVADEASDSLVRLETADGSFRRIPVGGPTRRLALTPDGSRLYVLRTDQPLVVLVDPALDSVSAPADAIDTARDPSGGPEGIRLPALPREIAFVQGVPYLVADELGQAKAWSTELLSASELAARVAAEPDYEEEAVTTLAYVSNLNGNVYVLDALNHRPIDRTPFLGPYVTIPGFNVSGKTQEPSEMDACARSPDCVHPCLAGYDRVYDGLQVTDPIYRGIWVTPGLTRTEDWVLRWEGVLPWSGRTATGRFEGFTLADGSGALDFQALGVEPGDLVQVRSDPLTDSAGGVHPFCSEGEGPTEKYELRRDFLVEAVNPGELALRPVAGVDPARCWPGAVLFQVRVQGAWMVWSFEEGLMGRAGMQPWQDPAPVPTPIGDGRIAFTMFAPADEESGQPRKVPRDAAWGFTTDSGFLPGQFAPAAALGLAGPLVALDLDAADPATVERVDDRVYLLFEGAAALMEFFPAALQSANFIVYQ